MRAKRDEPAYLKRLREQRKRWRVPEIVINPFGTLLYADESGNWQMSEWAERFLKHLRKIISIEEDPAPPVVLSIPCEQESAGLWDMILLSTGFSEFFGREDLPWPERYGGCPLGGIVALPNIGYPPGMDPYVYIDSHPKRLSNTLNHSKTLKPRQALYWVPGTSAKRTFVEMGLPIGSQDEDSLIECEEVIFCGLPEDVLQNVRRVCKAA